MSEAQKFKNLSFFLVFLRGHFSNFHIYAVFNIFLYRMDGLIVIYDKMIFFSGNLSGFRIFSGGGGGGGADPSIVRGRGDPHTQKHLWAIIAKGKIYTILAETNHRRT